MKQSSSHFATYIKVDEIESYSLIPVKVIKTDSKRLKVPIKPFPDTLSLPIQDVLDRYKKHNRIFENE